MDACAFVPPRTGELEDQQSGSMSVPESGADLLRSAWPEAAPELSRLVCAMGVRPDRAEDVLQDVYLAALRKPPPATDRLGLRRWLVRVTVNRCNLEHRWRARWGTAWRSLVRAWRRAARDHDPAAEVGTKEERAMVRRVLDRLDPRLAAAAGVGAACAAACIVLLWWTAGDRVFSRLGPEGETARSQVPPPVQESDRANVEQIDVEAMIAREARAARLAVSVRLLASQPGLEQYRDQAAEYLAETYGVETLSSANQSSMHN